MGVTEREFEGTTDSLLVREQRGVSVTVWTVRLLGSEWSVLLGLSVGSETVESVVGQGQ